VEFLDLVDENDRVVGKLPSRECIKRGLLHRAVVLFLFNQSGELYVQKRANDMVFYPGYWSASVTGHVSSGESYREAVIRETREELGIAIEPSEVGRFLSPKWQRADGVDWEQISVFEAVVEDPKITLSDESQEGRFVAVGEFKRLASAEPAVLTPDTLLSARMSSRLK
jgi:isopentenyl-diphosphate delta-isomerase type 1